MLEEVTTPSAAFTSDQDAAIAKLQTIQASLNGVFLEREAEVRGLLVGLLAGEHVVLLGPPGTGKSALTQAFSSVLSATYFQRLISKFTVPEELFGPFSLAALEADRYERQTDGYLPQAEVAFLDEIFKGNSAVLNNLLTILNERQFDNGTRREACPLKICVGASNELPNNAEGDSLDALYDRLSIRMWVSPLKNRASQRKLLRMKGAPAIAARISKPELVAAQSAVDQVEVPDLVIDCLLDLKGALSSSCGIEVSDRKLRTCEKLLRAYAALQGRSVVMPEDLEVLGDVLWSKPEERHSVMGQIMKVSNPAKAEAAKVFDAAVEAFQAVDLSAVTLRNMQPASKLLHSLKEMVELVRGMSGHPSVQGIADQIQRMVDEVGAAASEALTKA